MLLKSATIVTIPQAWDNKSLGMDIEVSDAKTNRFNQEEASDFSASPDKPDGSAPGATSIKLLTQLYFWSNVVYSVQFYV